MKSMSGILGINTRRRMIPFHPIPLHSFLTSLVNPPSMISHVYLHPRMRPSFITRKTHCMSVHHFRIERICYSLKIHLIFNLPFLETQRINLFTSHLPLYVIHQTMRMSTNILNFLILVVLIYSPHHQIMMLIHSLLIHLSHWFTNIHLPMKYKPHKISRNFSASWWLCQALVVLGLVSLLTKKLFKHSRLLMTHLYALKINLTLIFYFLHSNYMILSLMHWRNLTQQAHLHNISGLPFSCFLAYHG